MKLEKFTEARPWWGSRAPGRFSKEVKRKPQKALDQGLTPGPVATCWDLGAPWNGQQGDARRGWPPGSWASLHFRPPSGL